MTAGDGYPPHAGDPVPPAQNIPAAPGPSIPSWPKEWTVPSGQPPAPVADAPGWEPPGVNSHGVDSYGVDSYGVDSYGVDSAPWDTQPSDTSPLDLWQPAPPAGPQDPEPAAGSWFTPLAGHPDGEPAAPAQGRALGPFAAATRPPGATRPRGATRPPGAAVRRLRAAVRRRWIVPLAGGLAAVLAITGVVLATAPRHLSSGAARTGASPAATIRPMPAAMFPDTLMRDLTRDLQTGDETGFLRFVSADAQPSVRTWWENQQAMGFTTGVVLPMAVGDQVSVDREGNGTTTVLAGTHNILDPVDGDGKPAIGCERYQIGLHFASPAAIGQITSWTPLDNDPWDQDTPLYVRKAANVVVAGLPADSGFVNQTLPLAETAARYDIGLMDHGGRDDLHQRGFVVFVSAGSGAPWFGSGPQPAGWPSAYRGGRTVTLPGPGSTGDSSDLPAAVSDGLTGGARVVVTPFERDRGTARGETLTLVRDFMLDIVAPDDGEQVLRPVPSWALQGIGIMAQELYAGNANPAPKSYNFGPLKTALRKLPRAYRNGRLPASARLFSGSAAVEQNWNDVAASVYLYIGATYGVNRMLASAVLLYTDKNTPFANVVAPRKKGTSGFYPPRTIEVGWRAALARI